MPFTPDQPNKPSLGFVPDQSGVPDHVPSYDEIMNQPGDAGDLRRKMAKGIQSGGVGEMAAPIGGLAQLGLKKLSNFLKPAAERSAVLSQVKNEAGLGPYVANKIQQAGEAFNESQIEPKMAQQYKNAAGKFIEADPELLKGIHPEIDQTVSKYPVNQAGKIQMPMEDALDLRAELNSKTRFKQGGVYDTADQVRNAQSKAADAGSSLRKAMADVDPEIGQSSDQLRQSYNLKNAAIGSASKRPISSVLAPQASDKASTLAQFDQAAGSDLKGLGSNIQTAKNRLQAYTPEGLKKLFSIGAPKEAFDLATVPVLRGYDAAAQVASPLLEKAAQSPGATTATTSALQYLLQNKKDQ